MERTQIKNYSKEVGEKILRAWSNYKELFGLEADVIKKLEAEGKPSDEIAEILKKRNNEIRTIWPDLKKEA